MKNQWLWGAGAVAALAIGGGGWWLAHRDASQQADAKAPAPVAVVRTQLPRVQSVAQTLDALGDVSSAQTSGLGFARAGQITELSVVVGDRVRQGQVLAVLVPDPAVKQAWQQAVDAVDEAQRERDRQQQLLASHLATQSQADAAAKALLDARHALQALEEQGGGSGSSRLVAPFDGVVAAVSSLQGDRVQAGASVLQVGRDDLLRVTIGLQPEDRALVHAGTHVTLRAVASPGVQPPAVDLLLGEVQNSVDPKTQLVDAVAVVPRGVAARLAPGMKVAATLQVGAVSAVAVPRNAVLTDENGDYVFQVADGKARRVKVVRRLDNGVLAAIDGLGDLKQPVITEGNYELEDGMAVKDAAP